MSTTRRTRSTTRKGARAKHALRLPLQPIMDEFLEEVEQTLAPATERTYRIPLALFLRHLTETLGREPTLDDISVEAVRGWITVLRERPKRVRAGAGEGDAPIALASLRNYLRHLRAFANWLPKPPHRMWRNRRSSASRCRAAKRRRSCPLRPTPCSGCYGALGRKVTRSHPREGARCCSP